jgi:hypothetical protein
LLSGLGGDSNKRRPRVWLKLVKADLVRIRSMLNPTRYYLSASQSAARRASAASSSPRSARSRPATSGSASSSSSSSDDAPSSR